MDKIESQAVLAMPSIFIVRRPSHSFDRQNPILLYGLADFSVGISLRVVATRGPAVLVAATITTVRGRKIKPDTTG
jgi:hypothetical protein